MRLWDYVKDRVWVIVAGVLLLLISGIMLRAFGADAKLLQLAGFSMSVWGIVALMLSYARKRVYYQDLLTKLENLDRKLLIAEMIEPAGFCEGAILYDILKLCNKSMNDEIGRYSAMQKEYREYIEMWVHEIKTPIASAKLIAENNRSEEMESVQEELDKIEGFVEQALYYSRSNNVEKDYLITAFPLEQPVRMAVRRHAKELIARKISVRTENLGPVVYCDSKWIQFILEQIIANSIQYAGAVSPQIVIAGERREHSVRLTVRDNGIGIAPKDLGRVFEKGFTGGNGRSYGKSTGMGLYLCKKLCDKLSLGIGISSGAGEGTGVWVEFPVGDELLVQRKQQ